MRSARVPAGLVVALLVLMTTWLLARAEQPSGALYVTTLPAGADVWIDGTYLGRSPVYADALATGHHSLTLTKTGWIVQELDVEVKAGQPVISSIALTPVQHSHGSAMGSFVVRGAPAGAKLSLDGLPLDPSARPYKISAGVHRVTLTTAKGNMTSSFTVYPDTITAVVLHEPGVQQLRSSVVAPAERYLPAGAFSLVGKKVTIRYQGHVVIAHLGEHVVRFDGTAVDYGGVAETIDGKLYLPIELLERLHAETARSH